MAFKLFKKKEEEPEYVEIENLPEEAEVKVKIDVLNGLKDVSRIQEFVRNGNIVFVKISELKKKDMKELKQAVDRIKRTCTAIGGDLVGIDEDYLIITPSQVKIFR